MDGKLSNQSESSGGMDGFSVTGSSVGSGSKKDDGDDIDKVENR